MDSTANRLLIPSFDFFLPWDCAATGTPRLPPVRVASRVCLCISLERSFELWRIGVLADVPFVVRPAMCLGIVAHTFGSMTVIREYTGSVFQFAWPDELSLAEEPFEISCSDPNGRANAVDTAFWDHAGLNPQINRIGAYAESGGNFGHF